MKSFVKYFAYGIVFSGILLFLSFLLKFAPLDPKNGSIFSNGFVTGLALIGWGAHRIRINTFLRSSKMDIIYGARSSNIDTDIRKFEKLTDSQIPSTIGLFLAGAINLTLSFLL